MTLAAARHLATSVLVLAACGSDGTGPNPNAAVRYLSVSSTVGGAVPGVTVQFSATAYDSLGAVIPGAQVQWASQDSSLATVDADGLVTAIHPGEVVMVWSSSDPSIAQVDTGGLITTLIAGSTTIAVAAAVQGVTSSIEIQVERLRFVTAQEGGGFMCGSSRSPRTPASTRPSSRPMCSAGRVGGVCCDGGGRWQAERYSRPSAPRLSSRILRSSRL
jgi:Bacterial Ig-like domain (group 2)